MGVNHSLLEKTTGISVQELSVIAVLPPFQMSFLKHIVHPSGRITREGFMKIFTSMSSSLFFQLSHSVCTTLGENVVLLAVGPC